MKEFKENYNTVYIKCLEASNNLGFDVTSEDINDGVIAFRVGMSIWSFGERFKILITKINAKETRVEVTSEAALKVQVVDWGKNKENVQIFFEMLASLLKK